MTVPARHLPVVFLGPSLPVDEARALLDADYRPPAAHGDVLRAALRRPPAIGLIDGVFERVPAVWHKEVLWALAEGVPVYGAASMGALRAAELDRFGMCGVGTVYEAFATGVLEDDDEVAVAHAGSEDGYRALSDAMVDVRATLDAAVAAGVLAPADAGDLAARVKATYYPQRHLGHVLERGRPGHDALRAWLPAGWVGRKRADAVALLRRLAADLAGDDLAAADLAGDDLAAADLAGDDRAGDGRAADDRAADLAAADLAAADLAGGGRGARLPWTLQHTRYWDQARRDMEHGSVLPVDAAAEAGGIVVPAGLDHDPVLDEVRLDPDRFRFLVDSSLLAVLAGQAAAASGADRSGWAAQEALDEARVLGGLRTPADARAWLTARGWSDDDLATVARRLATLRWARLAHRDALLGELVPALQVSDDYPELARRAARKREVLASREDGEVPGDAALVAWYFHERLGRPAPLALEPWAQAHGWRRATDLLRALRAEWRFTRT